MRWRLSISLVVARLIDVQRSLGGECLGERAPAITLVIADMVSEQASSSLSEKQKLFSLCEGEDVPWPWCFLLSLLWRKINVRTEVCMMALVLPLPEDSAWTSLSGKLGTHRL